MKYFYIFLLFKKYAVSINNVLQNQLSKYFYEDDKFSYNG